VTVRTYRISNVTVASGIDLPELMPVTAATDWTFSLGASGRVRPSPDWFHRWRAAGGRASVSFARRTDGYLLRFHRFADFVVDLVERSIVCSPRRSTPLATVRHLLLDQVIPLVLSRDSGLVLHAAAVATPRGAIALVGRTGSGKSTLAAALATTGLPLLTDDCLVLEPARHGFAARSFYPGARLSPDSARAVGATLRSAGPVAHYTRKRRISRVLVPFREGSFPLAHLFMLEGPPRKRAHRTMTITRLPRREAMMAVLGCTFQLDVEDVRALRRGFELQSRLVVVTPVDRLEYPWRLATLAETRDALLGRLDDQNR
jgi:hypothetical protein